MEIDTLARTFPEIATTFDAACAASGITESEIAESAQCAQSTIGRIRKAEREPGVVVFTRAVLRLGKTPNDFLLRIPGDIRINDVEFDEDERADFARMVETFKTLKRRSRGPTSPVKMFTEALVAVEVTSREPQQIPVGSSIQKDGKITTYQPPPETMGTKMVGEEATPYGIDDTKKE